MLQELHELYAYNRWANQRILAAASTLSADQLTFDLRSSFPSVLATLGHILSADWIWLERWNGGSPLGFPESWDLSTFASVAERWDEVEQGRSAFLQRLKAEDLLRILHYRNTQGVAFAAPLWQLMRHVVNHSTYHRGQVVTLLRQLGSPAPSTDLVLYYRELAAAMPADPAPTLPRA